MNLGRGRFLSNVNNGARLWVAAAGPGYHSGRHHHKVRPTSPTSNLRPRKARKRPLLDHFLQEKILISLQTGGWPQKREACDRFFARGVCCRANSKIKGGGEGCAMAAWECSAGVTGQHYHPNCTERDAMQRKSLGSYQHLPFGG